MDDFWRGFNSVMGTFAPSWDGYRWGEFAAVFVLALLFAAFVLGVPFILTILGERRKNDA